MNNGHYLIFCTRSTYFSSTIRIYLIINKYCLFNYHQKKKFDDFNYIIDTIFRRENMYYSIYILIALLKLDK